MKPMMVRIQPDMVSAVKNEAATREISCTGVVQGLISDYFTSAKGGPKRNQSPVNGNRITVDDMSRFIRVHQIQHYQFAELMLVRPETLSRWFAANRTLQRIYQDRFRRVREHYPQQPPI